MPINDKDIADSRHLRLSGLTAGHVGWFRPERQTRSAGASRSSRAVLAFLDSATFADWRRDLMRGQSVRPLQTRSILFCSGSIRFLENIGKRGTANCLSPAIRSGAGCVYAFTVQDHVSPLPSPPIVPARQGWGSLAARRRSSWPGSRPGRKHGVGRANKLTAEGATMA
jgi:hypothetical protein